MRLDLLLVVAQDVRLSAVEADRLHQALDGPVPAREATTIAEQLRRGALAAQRLAWRLEGQADA